MSTVPKRDPLRAAYEDHMVQLYDLADAATHGYMVRAESRAQGITGADLYWPGAGRKGEVHASTELREAWDRGLAPRPLSWAEFRQLNGREPRVRDEYLGYAEAAELLGVKAKSLREYKTRGLLPPPDLTVSGVPAWKRSTWLRWDAARKARNANHRHEPIDWARVGF